MSQALRIHSTRKVDPEVRNLIWSEFFACRRRGVSLAVHSPWLDSGTGILTFSGHWYDVLAGCLILKPYHFQREQTVGMIGYVCVRPEYRGRGISHALLDAVRVHAEMNGMAGLVLWTKSPGIYAGHGFVHDDRDILQQFAPFSVCGEGNQSRPLSRAEWGERGLPAFAQAALTVQDGRASVIFLRTAQGLTLAEWSGADQDVISLLAGSCKKPWWINAITEDNLTHALVEHCGAALTHIDSARYVLALSGAAPTSIPSIRLLDGI